MLTICTCIYIQERCPNLWDVFLGYFEGEGFVDSKETADGVHSGTDCLAELCCPVVERSLHQHKALHGKGPHGEWIKMENLNSVEKLRISFEVDLVSYRVILTGGKGTLLHFVVATQYRYNQLFMRLRNLCVLAKKGNFKCTYVDFIYAWLYMGCGYLTVDINYANYICAIAVLLA